MYEPRDVKLRKITFESRTFSVFVVVKICHRTVTVKQDSFRI